jgi:YD repeat-containing protein
VGGRAGGNLFHTWDSEHPRVTGTDWTRELLYDERDRLETVREPWDADGNGLLDDAQLIETAYAYDDQDHLVTVTDAEGNVTFYEFSDRDLLTKETSPVSGQTLHTYNEHGELATTTDERGILVERTLDELGRVELANYKDNGVEVDELDVGYTYGSSAAAFEIGRLVGITRDAQTIPMAYDRFGRLTTDGGLGFGYDENGNRTRGTAGRATWCSLAASTSPIARIP